jgi:hypothetical protein
MGRGILATARSVSTVVRLVPGLGGHALNPLRSPGIPRGWSRAFAAYLLGQVAVSALRPGSLARDVPRNERLREQPPAVDRHEK